MATLTIRKLDKKAYKQLQVRAAKHGVSIEEETRQIIYLAVSAPEKISRIFKRYFGQAHGLNLDEISPRKLHEPHGF